MAPTTNPDTKTSQTGHRAEPARALAAASPGPCSRGQITLTVHHRTTCGHRVLARAATSTGEWGTGQDPHNARHPHVLHNRHVSRRAATDHYSHTHSGSPRASVQCAARRRASTPQNQHRLRRNGTVQAEAQAAPRRCREACWRPEFRHSSSFLSVHQPWPAYLHHAACIWKKRSSPVHEGQCIIS